MGYFVKFKLYHTTDDQEPYKIQKYEIENECFDNLLLLLPKDEGPYMVRYVDSDGDLCTIDDDLTLRTALKSVTNITSTLNLRIDHKATSSRKSKNGHKETRNIKSSKRNTRIVPIKNEIKKEIKEEAYSDSDISLGSDDEGSDVKSDDDYILVDDTDDEREEEWFEGDDSSDSDPEYSQIAAPKRKKSCHKQEPPSKRQRTTVTKLQTATVEAVPDEESMPDAPDKDPSVNSETADGVSDATKARIAKLLKTAYSEGNEHEQQQALKMAKRLLEKYNLTQADIEGKFTDESLPGGTSEVTIRVISKGTPTNEPPKQFERWWDLMAGTVAKNFAVKCYITRKKGKIVFYGLLKNCQTAAFAYSLAFNFTHVNQRNYVVPEGEYEMQCLRGWTQATKGTYTTNARRNYTLGVVNGLNEKVEETLKEERAEKAKRERKILRLQYKLKSTTDKGTKEAYNSDTESESDSDGTVDLCSDSNDTVDLSKMVKKEVKEEPHDESQDVKPDIKELQEKVIKLEREEKARTALVIHSENVPERVLQDLKKKEGLKIGKGKKFQRLKEGNRAAWQKGVKDGKEINLNQKAIKNKSEDKRKNRKK